MFKKVDLKKIELDKSRPLPKETLDNLDKWFEIELTYTSNAIEGNTLTRSETYIVLEKGLTVSGKPLKDHLELVNHKEALTFIKSFLRDDKLIDLKFIMKIHELVTKDTCGEYAGGIRNGLVTVPGSKVIFPSANKLLSLLKEYESWLKQNKLHPIELAAIVHCNWLLKNVMS